MSLDGRFIEKLSIELNSELQNGRIQKIYQLTKTDFLFMIRNMGKNFQLNLSLSTSLARIHLTKYTTDHPENPTGFCMFLRKYLEGGIIHHIQSLDGDRIVEIKIENQNEIGINTIYYMYYEMMSRYANLVITDQEYHIIEAFKHISPFEDKRTILKGIRYLPPEDNKINPNDIDKVKTYLNTFPISSYKQLIENFRGFSPLFSKYIVSQLTNQEVHPTDIVLKLLQTEVKPTLCVLDDSRKFYYFDLFPSGTKTNFSSLSQLLDEVYHETSQIERQKQISKNLIQFIKREYEKNIHKLEKLKQDLIQANQSDLFKRKGDLILQHMPEITKGDAYLKAIDYMTGEEIDIDMDRLLTPIQNANLYFKKYKKAKSAVKYIEEQIQLTEKQIDYFDLLTTQVETSSFNDLDEIGYELSLKGFVKKNPKAKRKNVPNFDVFLDDSGIEIVVGKNNIQNEYITHKLGKNNQYWFHTKEAHGSHVLVKSEGPLSEVTIRTAAHLAAYFSKSRFSSSVAVDYTLIKNVKKIPGEIGSYVGYTNQKTIYIDPSKEFVFSLKQRKH